MHLFCFEILIAAHCLFPKGGSKLFARDIAVILGAHNLKRPVEQGKISPVVKSIEIHDAWNPNVVEFEGDIAVIKLSGKVPINEFIRPVCLADPKLHVNILNGTVVGWGYHDETNSVSSVPKKVQLPILGDRDCLKRAPGLLSIISHDLFCAGKERAGVCQGDSGSGFYIEVNGTVFLRGIVSSSSLTTSSCSEANNALYSDILKNIDFLAKVRFWKNSKIKH